MILEVYHKTIYLGINPTRSHKMTIDEVDKAKKIEIFLLESDINYDYAYFSIESLKEIKKLKRTYGIVRRK